MVLEEMNAIYNSWDFLQQPIHPGQGMNASFRSLLAAIDQGWQVEEPVKKLPAIRPDSWTYYFVLFHRNFHQICQIVVPAAPEIDRFLRSNDYQVEKILSPL